MPRALGDYARAARRPSALQGGPTLAPEFLVALSGRPPTSSRMPLEPPVRMINPGSGKLTDPPQVVGWSPDGLLFRHIVERRTPWDVLRLTAEIFRTEQTAR